MKLGDQIFSSLLQIPLTPTPLTSNPPIAGLFQTSNRRGNRTVTRVYILQSNTLLLEHIPCDETAAFVKCALAACGGVLVVELSNAHLEIHRVLSPNQSPVTRNTPGSPFPPYVLDLPVSSYEIHEDEWLVATDKKKRLWCLHLDTQLFTDMRKPIECDRKAYYGMGRCSSKGILLTLVATERMRGRFCDLQVISMHTGALLRVWRVPLYINVGNSGVWMYLRAEKLFVLYARHYGPDILHELVIT